VDIAEKVFTVRGQRSRPERGQNALSRRDSHQLTVVRPLCVRRRHANRRCGVEATFFAIICPKPSTFKDWLYGRHLKG